MTKKLKTSENIIIASKKLFPQHGYKNTTMDMIAKEASIRKSLVTYHFPKKQLILIHIMGTFLNTVYDYAKTTSNNNPLLSLFLTNYIYYNYLYNEYNIEFSKGILNRKDRNDLLTYENFQVLYIDIVKYFNVNISFNTLVLREIVIYGSTKEILNNYLLNIIDYNLNEIIEHITENTCRLLEISDHIIEEYKLETNKILPHLDFSHIHLF